MVFVVGVDGSDESRAALAWATHTAAPSDVLEAVHVVRADGDHSDAVTDLERWVPDVVGLQVRRYVAVGRTADALIERADEVGADLVVVGAHARPRLAPRTLGRVTSRLVHRTDRPLAVVGTRSDVALADEDTVVAGVGSGPATTAALAWAADYAQRHDTSLSLVQAVGARPVFGRDGILDVMAFYVDRSLLRDWALEDLEKLADELQRATEDDLPITWSAPVGSAGPMLVEAGAEASLLVVGRHGDGALDERVMAPAMHHVLTHAPCTVVVVPPPDGS